jgi:hypothetical protein
MNWHPTGDNSSEEKSLNTTQNMVKFTLEYRLVVMHREELLSSLLSELAENITSKLVDFVQLIKYLMKQYFLFGALTCNEQVLIYLSHINFVFSFNPTL